MEERQLLFPVRGIVKGINVQREVCRWLIERSDELINEYGAKNLIRIGSCGAFQPELKLMDIILAQAASTDSHVNRLRFGGMDFAPVADFGLLTDSEEENRHAELPGDGDHDPALGRTVDLAEEHTSGISECIRGAAPHGGLADQRPQAKLAHDVGRVLLESGAERFSEGDRLRRDDVHERAALHAGEVRLVHRRRVAADSGLPYRCRRPDDAIPADAQSRSRHSQEAA